MSADLHELLQLYTGAGIGVFPLHGVGRDGICTCGKIGGTEPGRCHSPAKHPLLPHAHRWGTEEREKCKGECGRIGHGFLDATTDMGQVAEWLAAHPGANWGIRPPDTILVVDVDPRNGGDTELARLEAEHGALPATLTAETGSGGRHIWFSYKGPLRGKLGPGLDIKGNNGYLVAPPSKHISGGTYTWLDFRPAAYAPAWIKAAMNPPVRIFNYPAGKGGSIAPLVQFVLDSQEGERNRRLYWAACRAAERQLDPQPLIDAATSIGQTPMEARATVASASRAAPRSASATTRKTVFQ